VCRNESPPHDLELTEHKITPVIIGASIIDDVLALSFFTAIIDISNNSGSVDWLQFSIIMAKAVLFFVIAIGIGTWFYPKIGKYFVERLSIFLA
jgi:Kef-type K+ transport system membrane component KefB